ncbi:MAG TPA: methyltransferase [Pseudonocardiaceae bacterium]
MTITENDTRTGADLGRVQEIGLGFATAKILLTALELGLFTNLALEGPATAEEIRVRLGLNGRGVVDLLGALETFGVLERDGERYRNTPVADAHLVRGPHYDAGFLEGANFALYPAWGGLSAALRTGAPQNIGDFEAMLSDPEGQRRYLAMMDSLSGPLAPEIASALDWRAHHVLTDVGGARGNMTSLLLRRFEHLRGVVFDRPQNAPACAEHTAALGTAGRVEFRGGDFFTDELPETDVLIIGHVLADFSLEVKKSLVQKAFRAVRPGGAFIVYDPMPDPEQPDIASTVASLHMLVMSPAGAGYRPGDCVGWMADAGFDDISTRKLSMGNSLVVARKR